MAIEHYKLHENEEIMKFKQLIVMQEQSEQQKLLEASTLPQEMKIEMLKEADYLGKPQLKKEQIFTFDYYLESQKIC